MRRYRSVSAAILAAFTLVVAGCTPGSDPTPSESTLASTTAAPTPVPTDLPGEPFDIGPLAGDVLAVVGIQHDETLDLLAAPGTDQPVLAGLDPLADDVVATGNGWLTEGVGAWWEVQAAGATGWANSAQLAWIGQTTDETAALISRLGGRPEAANMLELGQQVADEVALDDEEISSDIVVTVAPTDGDPGEVTYDVIGLADDSVWGLRLHVFGAPAEDGSSYSLTSVEQTLLCGRGGSPTTPCV